MRYKARMNPQDYCATAHTDYFARRLAAAPTTEAIRETYAREKADQFPQDQLPQYDLLTSREKKWLASSFGIRAEFRNTDIEYLIESYMSKKLKRCQ